MEHSLTATLARSMAPGYKEIKTSHHLRGTSLKRYIKRSLGTSLIDIVGYKLARSSWKLLENSMIYDTNDRI